MPSDSQDNLSFLVVEFEDNVCRYIEESVNVYKKSKNYLLQTSQEVLLSISIFSQNFSLTLVRNSAHAGSTDFRTVYFRLT